MLLLSLFPTRIFRLRRSATRAPGLWLAVAAVLAVTAHTEGAGFERRFERLDASDGLSESSVTSLDQDAQGFLWIGTDEGLNRFDGSNVTVFRRSADGSSQGLGSNRISALLVTREGVLWVGTQGGGLSRYHPELETFTTFRHDPEDPESLGQDDIAHLAQDELGRLWIATFRGGLSLLEDPGPDGETVFRRIVHDPNDPTSLADNRTRTVFPDRFGVLWIATMGGIDRVTADPRWGDASFAFAHSRNRPDDPTSLPDDEVWAVYRDSSGDLWAGMWGAGDGCGLARARLPDAPEAIPPRLSFECTRTGDRPTTLADDRVMEIFEDGQGALWIGTLGGLHELRPGQRDREEPRFVRHLPDSQWEFSLPAEDVYDLMEDSEGDLWVATSGGVGRVDRSHENAVTLRVEPDSQRGLSGAVTDAWIDHQGVLWVATTTGLDRVELDDDGYEIERFTHDPERPGHDPQSLPIPAPIGLEETADGWIWMPSYQWMAAVAPRRDDGSPPRFVHFTEGLSSNAVLTLLEDPAGSLWAGTYRALHRIARDDRGRPIGIETWRHEPGDPASLSNQSVGALASGPRGNLWVGTYVGLNRFDPSSGEVTRFLPDSTDPNSLSQEFVTSLSFDPSGALWIGTRGGGLDRLEPESGRFTHYGIEDGLPSENVFSVCADEEGSVWFASPRGLVRLEPATGDVRVFGRLDGLPEDMVSHVRIARDGTLLVGTASGLTLLSREHFEATGSVPPVVLTGLRIRNQPVPIGSDSILQRALAATDRLVLHHSDDLVAIEFAAVTFRRPQRTRYRYRLEGLDDRWVETGAGDARATFTTLPPGSYTFRVQSADPDGVWNVEGASLAIEVLPPWYLTWWAQAGAAVLILGAVVALPLVRLRRARRLNVLLEARVAERTEDLTRANRMLEAAARTDFLTGLPNRREFFIRAEREQLSQQQTARPFALAIADIDNFKTINDTWGHSCGDFVLVELAALLRTVVRRQDVVARWGGEELIFLFPDTDVDGAMVVAEKARRAAQGHHLVWDGEEVEVTLTLGVVEVDPGTSLDAATSAADAALYDGKRQGKNRVVAAPSLEAGTGSRGR